MWRKMRVFRIERMGGECEEVVVIIECCCIGIVCRLDG